MLRAGFALALLVGSAVPATAAPPSPDPKSLTIPQEELSKARELVHKLGSETFTEREEAERDLAAMGRAARAALLDGANTDPDPEIRSRSQPLLKRAIALETKARLDSFLADIDGKYQHDLPGWNRLRATVRGDFNIFGWTWTARPDVATEKAARELFVEFLNATGGRKLLSALGSGTSDLGPTIAALKQDLYYARLNRAGAPARTVTAMEVALILFVDSQVPYKGGAARNGLFANVLTTSGVIQATNGTDGKSQALKAILMAWVDTRTDAYEMYSAMNLANNAQNNDVAGRMAIRLLTSAGAPGSYKGLALTTIVRLKMTDQLPAIEKVFADATVLTTTIRVVNGMQVRQSIEVRDAVLAAVLVMTGQNPEDYGFDAFPKNPGIGFSYSYARISDEKRAAAFMKYGWSRMKESLKSSAEK